MHHPLYTPFEPVTAFLPLDTKELDLVDHQSARPPPSNAPADVVKTRVQAEQAEAVTRQSASTRATAEACDICGQQQGRLYTTSARAPSPGATLAGFDASISASAVGAAVRERPPALPTGTLAGLHHIARWEGIRSLYRGLEISLVMAIPSTVLYYTVYDLLLEELEKAGAGKFLAPATAGSSARTLSTAVMAPLELVRTRAQSERAAVSGVAEKDFSGASLRGSGGGVGGAGASVGKMLATVFKEEGAAALWRGVGTTMWRDVPFSMMYWLGYENLKSGLGCGRDVDGGHQGARGAGKSAAEERGSADFLTRSFTAGAVSGMFAGLVTQPFDVVKTQQQLIFKGASGESESLATRVFLFRDALVAF